MSDTTNKPDKAQNYTPEMEAAIKAASPLDLESAKALGVELGKGYRSIISKAKSMDLPYIVKPAPKKKVAPVTKAQLVTMISDSLDSIHPLDGLDKATAGSLVHLLESIADWQPSIVADPD